MNRYQSPWQRSCVPHRCIVLAVLLLTFPAPRAFAAGPKETVLHSFISNGAGNATDGGFPGGSLVMDDAGNLYGATTGGGNAGCLCGTVFELSAPATAGGEWIETTLHMFRGGATDGSSPFGGIIRDSLGNLYGTTANGGPHDRGTIFELSPPRVSGGDWTETILWVFDPVGGVNRGYAPLGNLVMDRLGNLYGTTRSGGGACVCGIVFELVAPRAANSHWQEKVLYEFDTKGTGPWNLLLRNGILYGTTKPNFPKAQPGVVYQLVLQSGIWQRTTLYTFTGEADGSNPGPSLLQDSGGNLFGITTGFNSTCTLKQVCGTIFELSPPSSAGGEWQLTTLYTFAPGLSPMTIRRESDGTIYGTTTGLGDPNTDDYFGTFFKLSPPANSAGEWTQTTLHVFGKSDDGIFPTGGLLHVNGQGFYGLTSGGGDGGFGAAGTVYNFVP